MTIIASLINIQLLSGVSLLQIGKWPPFLVDQVPSTMKSTFLVDMGCHLLVDDQITVSIATTLSSATTSTGRTKIQQKLSNNPQVAPPALWL